MKRSSPENIVILVVGGKGSGKSSIINNIVKELNLELVATKQRSFFHVSKFILSNAQNISTIQKYFKCSHQNSSDSSKNTITHFSNLISNNENSETSWTTPNNKLYVNHNSDVPNKICYKKCFCIEFREINSVELYSDYNMCSLFFENALA